MLELKSNNNPGKQFSIQMTVTLCCNGRSRPFKGQTLGCDDQSVQNKQNETTNQLRTETHMREVMARVRELQDSNSQVTTKSSADRVLDQVPRRLLLNRV